MEIQIQYMHDIKSPLDLGKSVSGRLIELLHGTETSSLRLHAQYLHFFFLFFFFNPSYSRQSKRNRLPEENLCLPAWFFLNKDFSLFNTWCGPLKLVYHISIKQLLFGYNQLKWRLQYLWWKVNWFSDKSNNSFMAKCNEHKNSQGETCFLSVQRK